MRWLLRAVAVAVAVTPACQPAAGPLSAIGVDGGRIVSDDGRLTINVPRGALAEAVLITIGRTEERGKVCYELGPRGTAFRVPVTVTFAAPVAWQWNMLGIEEAEQSRICPHGA